MESDPMKLPWWKVAAAAGFACAATIGISELGRWSKQSCAEPDPHHPIVAIIDEAAPTPAPTDAPWKSATELDDETAGIDPEAMLPAKLQLVGLARADLEFAAAAVPQTKKDGPDAVEPELKNPTREEVLLKNARDAKKKKDYNESAKFYLRTLEVAPNSQEVKYEYAEMLAEAGKSDELKAFLSKIGKEAPKDDAAKKRVAALVEKDQKAKEPSPPTPPMKSTSKQPSPPLPTLNPPPPTDAKKTPAKLPTLPLPPPSPKETVEAPKKTGDGLLKTVEAPKKTSDAPKPADTVTAPLPPMKPVIPPPKPLPPALKTETIAKPQPNQRGPETAVKPNPDEARAKLGLARMQLDAWRCSAAAELLAAIAPKLGNDREYRLTVAWRHAIVGEYHDAKKLLERLLDEAPGDPNATLALADLYLLAGDYNRALGEYGKIGEGGEASPDALLGAAHALMELTRYEDAFLICKRRLASDPNNADAVVLLTEALRRMGKCDDAIVRCKRHLESLPEVDRAGSPIRIQLAKLHLHKGRTEHARAEFETLATTPAAKHPIVVWGLWAFPGKTDDKQRPPTPPVPPEDVNFAVVVSEFLLKLDHPGDAVHLLEQASAASPSELLLLVRLGDARSKLRTGTGRYSAMDSYMRALTLSPNNNKAMLGYAKAARHAGMFGEGLSTADKLLKLDPQDAPATFEKARTLYAMRCYAEADAVYARGAATTGEERLRRELGRIAGMLPPERQQSLAPALTAEPGHVREVLNVVAQQDEGLLEDLVRIGAEYDAARATSQAFAEERAVKSYGDWSPIRAIDAAVRRLESHPLDDEAAFDLARNYSTLHTTREAEKFYRKVLLESPNHYCAGVAADRLDLEHGSRARAEADYFRQRGRDGLTEIDRFRTQAWLSMNLGDEDEYIAVGEGWIRLDPTDGSPAIDGNIASLRAQYKPFDLLLLHGQFNGETYDAGFRNRLTYDIGAAWRASDCMKLFASVFSQNVAENGESIRQDVNRDGFIVGVDYTFNRCDDSGAWYRWADYSDENQLHEFDLYASHRFSLWPTELKLIGDFHYWSFDNGTTFPVGLPFGSPLLLGAVHPYFAPNGYGLASAHLEWTKCLSGDTFKEADLTWVGLRGGGGVDTDGVPFLFGRAMFHRDFCYWLSFHTELGATESRVYRDVSAYAYLTARLRKFSKSCWATDPSR
jgi:tetratricopeptide (TPR) repeat protein